LCCHSFIPHIAVPLAVGSCFGSSGPLMWVAD